MAELPFHTYSPCRINTHSGKWLDPTDLHPIDVDIGDIAQALSMICRYTGHVNEFYSVAQHSTLMWDWLRELDAPLEEQLQGLLHDAEEAYMGDVAKHLKSQPWMYEFRKRAEAVRSTILQHYRLPPILTDRIKQIDNELLTIEAKSLKKVHDEMLKQLYLPSKRFVIVPQSQKMSRLHFLKAFESTIDAIG